MAELAQNIDSSVGNLYSKLEKSETRLKSLDANITKLTGRDPSERRIFPGNIRNNNNTRDTYQRSNADPYERRPTNRDYGKRRDSRDGRGVREPRNIGDGRRLSDSRGARGDRDMRGGDMKTRDARRSRDGRDERYQDRNADANRNDDVFTPTKQKSVVASSIIIKPDETISRSQEITKESNSTPTDLKKRNKRMFGMLMGTLNQFKSQENTVENKSIEKRKQVEKRIEEKAIEEKRTQNKEKMELFNMRKQEKRNIFETKFKMEVAQMHMEWDKSKNSLKTFLKTKVKPCIFFKPNNMDNKKIKEAHESSCKRIDDEIKERRFAFDSSLQQQIDAEKNEAHIEHKQETRKRKDVEDGDRVVDKKQTKKDDKMEDDNLQQPETKRNKEANPSSSSTSSSKNSVGSSSVNGDSDSDREN